MISMTRFRFHYRKPGHLHVCTSGTDLDDRPSIPLYLMKNSRFDIIEKKKENQVLMKSSKVKMLVLEKKVMSRKKRKVFLEKKKTHNA